MQLFEVERHYFYTRNKSDYDILTQAPAFSSEGTTILLRCTDITPKTQQVGFLQKKESKNVGGNSVMMRSVLSFDFLLLDEELYLIYSLKH